MTVAEFKKIQDEYKRAEALYRQASALFVEDAEQNGWDTLYDEDGIHYVRFTKAQEPKWVEEKITPAHFDNGKKAYIRYY